MFALLDGDILCYRVAAATENEEEKTAIHTLAVFLEELVMCPALLKVEESFFYLTGKNNFRYDIAKTVPYKGNRKDKPKPKHLPLLREYLEKAWGAEVAQGQEADDAIVIKATELGYDESIIVSLDKDFLQVPTWHYNFVKNTLMKQSDADALLFFYSQILTGDSADNVQGVKGVGPVKAAKMLKEAKTAQEMYAVCVEALGQERAFENASLLYLRRHPNEKWEPPVGDEKNTEE